MPCVFLRTGHLCSLIILIDIDFEEYFNTTRLKFCVSVRNRKNAILSCQLEM